MLPTTLCNWINFTDKMSRSPCYIDHYLRWICVLKIEAKYNTWKWAFELLWKFVSETSLFISLPNLTKSGRSVRKVCFITFNIFHFPNLPIEWFIINASEDTATSYYAKATINLDYDVFDLWTNLGIFTHLPTDICIEIKT